MTRRTRVFQASALSVAFAALPIAAPAAAVFVGPASDPDCDFHTIQAAIDAWAASTDPGQHTIYVSNLGTYPATALTIPTPLASMQLALSGTVAGCSLDRASGHVVLDGTGNGGLPIIDVNGSVAGDAHRFEVSFNAFELRGGDRATGNGGALRVRGNAVVGLADADLHDNRARNGGAVAIEGTPDGAPHLVLFGLTHATAIRDNQAELDGGGLYCENATMYCDRYCLVADNSAGQDGGGVAQHGCTTSLSPAKSAGEPDANVGLLRNTALRDGGGAWLGQGGTFSVRGATADILAPVIGNVAGRNGGGVSLVDNASGSVQTYGVRFEDNRAGADGGAIHADSGFVFADAIPNTGCGGLLEQCARFAGNHADGSGGAIALAGAAGGVLSSLVFTGNDAAHASVMQLGDASGGATLTNAHIAGNHGAPELLRSSGGYVEMRYTTLADNGSDDDTLVRFDAAGNFGARNSILYDFNGAGSGSVVESTPGTVFRVDCVLVHDATGLDGVDGVTSIVVADPQWDTSGRYPAGAFVPGPDSPAVDACGQGPGAIADLLGTQRPQDTARPDALGSFDMGAVERAPDEVFSDGFDGLILSRPVHPSTSTARG